MKRQVVILFLLLTCFVSNGQTQDSLQQLWEARFKQIKYEDSLTRAKVFYPGEKIEVCFYFEGRQIALDKNVEIFFVIEDSIGKTILKPRIECTGFLLPDLKKYETGIFAIKYKGKVYATTEYLQIFQKNNSLKIIFDSKPYTKKVLKDKYNIDVFPDVKNDKDLQKKETKAFLSISYMHTVSTTLIHDKREYFMSTRKLIE